MSDILSRLAPPPGARTKKKRLGRGPGSGLGKTSGRGQNGQKSRSGGSIRRGFEGGQMPAQRRLPKRGFKNPFRKRYSIVNLVDLDSFADGEFVDIEVLIDHGLVSKRLDGVKILGNGEITKKLSLRVDAISESARVKITSAGGKIELI
jgi:large subunit ribosomal protein L15